MPVTKAEYKQWKQSSPKYAILHKLHSQDVFENFGGLPRPVIMTWADYDKFIHLDDLCAYDLLAVMLGRLSGQVFMFDAPRKWLLAIGDNDVAVEGIVDGDY